MDRHYLEFVYKVSRNFGIAQNPNPQILEYYPVWIFYTYFGCAQHSTLNLDFIEQTPDFIDKHYLYLIALGCLFVFLSEFFNPPDP